MARKAPAKKTSTKKATTSTRGKRSSVKKPTLELDHSEAAYFNWLLRGAPLWDDQHDWFSVNKNI
ncbi:MAG: hypothetical protein IME96_01365 [Proteobacteria bacterium]|nr:hypothetical protein [Pseudomonadota bacterium]